MGNLRKIFVGEIKENYKFSKCWSTHIKGITGWMSYEEALLLFEVARIISERRENFLMVEIGSVFGGFNIYPTNPVSLSFETFNHMASYKTAGA
jgi:hypothetical protein